MRLKIIFFYSKNVLNNKWLVFVLLNNIKYLTKAIIFQFNIYFILYNFSKANTNI